MTLRQRLDELRALEQKATPGPWDTGRFGLIRDGDPVQYVNGYATPQIAATTGPKQEEDCALIAALRNTIGPLLEVVEAQHRALEGISMIDYTNAATNGCAYAAVVNARAALALMDKEEA